MPLIPAVNERKLWVIISTRKANDSVNELDVVKPLLEELNF